MWNSNDFIPNTDRYNVQHKYLCISFIAGFQSNGSSTRAASRFRPAKSYVAHKLTVYYLQNVVRHNAQDFV
jgi:hypothetical protein